MTLYLPLAKAGVFIPVRFQRADASEILVPKHAAQRPEPGQTLLGLPVEESERVHIRFVSSQPTFKMSGKPVTLVNGRKRTKGFLFTSTTYDAQGKATTRETFQPMRRGRR